MADDHSELIAGLVAITGCEHDAALTLLEATDWSLDAAVNLHFASAEATGGQDGASASGAAAAGGGSGGDEVRAPLPTKVDRLYGNMSDVRMLAAASAAQYGINGQPKVVQPVDVFRDFKAESAEGTENGPGGGSGGSGLSQLFKPPKDLLFEGGFDMAKMRASQEGKWLLLNLQSNSEFDSHRLNRDTWGNDALKELVRGMFLFFQENESTPDGHKLVSMYKAARLPAILVLDPISGANLYSRSGFIDAEKLLEDLVPFMDHGPTDPGAGMMAHQMGLKRKVQESAASAAAPPGTSGGALSEEEQLNMAIAMSMQAAGRGGAGGAGSGDVGPPELDDLDEAAIWEQICAKEAAEAAATAAGASAGTSARVSGTAAPTATAMDAAASAPPPCGPSAEQRVAEAAARLPAEPDASASGACRVALRLPDGARVQRRFLASDALQAVHDFAVVQMGAAAGGRPFELSGTAPGAPPLPSDAAQTLEAAGVANAMLAVKWL